MPRLTVAELKSGMELNKAPFMLAVAEQATDRNGDTYLKLTLRDRTGDIEGRYWRVPPGVYEGLTVGQGIAISGRVSEYKGTRQVTVTHAFACPIQDPSEYMPTARRASEEMIQELQRIISSIRNLHLKKLLKETLGEVDLQARFLTAPAAKLYHHACVGGLLEHSLDVARQAIGIAKRYPEVDRDLVTTVALLHDVGKVDSYDAHGAFDFTDVGRLWGHIFVGASMIDRAIDRIEGFPHELRLRVVHAVLAHHGELAKGSPVIPLTPEAIVLHYADSLDGSLRGWVDHVEREQSADEAWTSRSNMHGSALYIGGHRTAAKEDV